MTDNNPKDLRRQKDLSASFQQWFAGAPSDSKGLKSSMESSRRRYRMVMEDEDERTSRGLSALPSTKSTSTVDNFVIDAMMEYHQSKDDLAYTAKNTAGPHDDDLARWLTELVHYRMEHTFPFGVWHMSSLKIGAVDGMEAALVTWRKEQYDYSVPHYMFSDGFSAPQELQEQQYQEYKRRFAGTNFAEMLSIKQEKKSRTTLDSWWINQLKPGESIMWDFQNPLLDVNLGQWCIVVLDLTRDDMERYIDVGLFDEADADELVPLLAQHAKARGDEYTDQDGAAPAPASVDVEGYNRIPVWLTFTKEDSQWKVEFSIEDKFLLSSRLDVNKIFWNDRPVDLLPVVLGCHDLELWEAVGRSIPKLIKPVEDELEDQKNNFNDLAKELVQRKWRVEPDSDIDMDDLLNARIFRAAAGEAEPLDVSPGAMEALRASDSLTSDLHELVPAGMESRNFIPKGTNKTLGALQLATNNNDQKSNARLMVRNATFMVPLMRLIAEMELSWESDETIGRLTATKSGMKMIPAQGQNIDFRALDFDYMVEINAGLGQVPKHLKAQKLMELSEWGKGHGIQIDIDKIFDQIAILNGFNPEQLKPEQQQAPPPKPQDIKVTVNIDFDRMGQPMNQVQQKLMTMVLEQGQITGQIKENPQLQGARKELDSPMRPMIEQMPQELGPQ